jgi:ligand-binding SRPBCC domain-containing protein
MKLERLHTIQRLPVQIEEAWDFFTSPKNVGLITPPWLDFRMISDPPEYLHPGTLVASEIRPVPGISIQWISEITHIRPPHFYITEQRVGPFKLWHHEHYFRVAEEGIEVEDIVYYGLYLGPVGSLAHDLYVRKKLHEVFTHRARAIEQRFGSIGRPKRQAPPQPAEPAHGTPLPSSRRPPPQQPQPRPRPQGPPTSAPAPNPGAVPDRPITLEDIFGTGDD